MDILSGAGVGGGAAHKVMGENLGLDGISDSVLIVVLVINSMHLYKVIFFCR